MNKYLRIILGSLLLVLLILVSIFFLYIKQNYAYNTLEFAFSRMITLLFFNILFFSFFFLIDIKFYGIIFIFFVIFGIAVWTFEYLLQFLDLEVPNYVYDLNDLILFSAFNIVAPGLNLVIVYYIKKIGSKYAGTNLFGKYHVHESFFGALLLLVALILYLLRSVLIQYRVFWRELRLLLAIEVIFLFLVLYFGSFFIFRDWRDVIRLKFIEKFKSSGNSDDGNYQTKTFKQITINDLHFFNSPKVILYPFGMFLASFAFSMICFGTYFLPKEIFKLDYEPVVQLGFLFSFIAAGIIGIDWVRIFKRFYPELYHEIELVIKEIDKKNLK